MAYQFVSEDPMPAQKPPLQERVQVTEYKTQKIYDSNAHKELFLGRSLHFEKFHLSNKRV